MDMVKQVMAKVNKIFDKDYLEALARETGLIKRKRKLDAKILLEKLILLRLESANSSLEDLVYEFYKSDLEITKQALHKKFNTTALGVQKVLEKLLEDMIDNQRKNINILPCVKAIRVVDSSEIRLNKILKNIFPQVRNQGAAVKLQSLMDVLSNQLLLLDVRPSNEPDQGYKKHIAHIQAGDLLIGDLGYFCIDSFKEIQAKEGFFLSRYFKKTNLYDLNTEEQIDLRAILKHRAKEEKVEFQIALGTPRFPCRLIAIKLTEDAYQQRLKNLAEKHRKDPRSKATEYDSLNRWSVFVTNLPLPMEGDTLLGLYSLRWQIELLFKMMKTFLNLRKIDDTNPDRASISVYISLIAMTLLSYVTMTITENEISLYKASKTFCKCIRKFFDLMREKKKCPITWLRAQINKFAFKESRRNRPSTKLSLETAYA